MPRKVLGVIPARFASSRFPGKALALIAGRPMIEHVWERACQAKHLSQVVIATDDERIAQAARRFHAPVRMTRPDHRSGTDRAAEAVASIPCDLVVNIQGDEPLIDPEAIDAAVRPLLDDEQAPMSTLRRLIEDPADVVNPNAVKVVTDQKGYALYFSRCPIPYARDGSDAGHWLHVGLYVYRRDFLLQFPGLPVGPLEKAESLEQLRALENGYKIRVVETRYASLGVDTPEDLERINRRFAGLAGINSLFEPAVKASRPAATANLAEKK